MSFLSHLFSDGGIGEAFECRSTIILFLRLITGADTFSEQRLILTHLVLSLGTKHSGRSLLLSPPSTHTQTTLRDAWPYTFFCVPSSRETDSPGSFPVSIIPTVFVAFSKGRPLGPHADTILFCTSLLGYFVDYGWTELHIARPEHNLFILHSEVFLVNIRVLVLCEF